jgi:hypothetical protein
MSALTLVLATSGLSGCAATTPPTLESRLVGTWEWVEMSGGIAGVTMTPASTGHTRSLRFTETGRVEAYEDGDLKGTVGFKVAEGADDETLAVQYDAPLMDFDAQTATFPADGELVLIDPCCDGFMYRYVRAS